MSARRGLAVRPATRKQASAQRTRTVLDAAAKLVQAGRVLYEQERAAPAWADLTPASQDHWIGRAAKIVRAYNTEAGA